MAIEIADLLEAPRETLSIEHKSWLDLTEQHHRGVLAKAIIALANHGGGYIVLGINEEGADRIPVARPNRISKYTSESVAAIVKKFVDPVFECLLDHVIDPSSGVELAVLTVPGGIPDIVLAKSGIVDGPITEFRPYIRKPGPASEMPTTIAEWRNLFDRCVKARQAEMLGAIRAIVLGAPEQPEGSSIDERRAHNDFTAAALERWKALLERTTPRSSARFPLGHWSATFSLVGDFERPTLRELLNRLNRAEDIKHSGWPTFLVMNREPFAPQPVGDGIETWIYEDDRNDDPAHCDFWRVSRDGRGFMIRGYQEDHFAPRLAPGTGLDITTPTWRVGELILFTARLAALFGSIQRVDLSIRYTGLSGRRLVSYGNPNRWIMEGRATRQDTYDAGTSYDPVQIPGILPETVYGLLAPLYETFGFFELPRQLVAEELETMQRNRF